MSWSKNHNIPDLYQNYANLSSLANAIGDIFHIKNYKIELPNGGNGQISLPSTSCFIVAVPRGASYQITVMCVEDSRIAFIKDGYVKERWSVTREGIALPILHFAACAEYFEWRLIVLAIPE